MTSPPRTRRLADDAGFTLVELMVAMIVSSIVVFAILNTLDSFSSNAARQTKVTDANDKVRSTMDRVVADLRQAATIEVAGANDLVYTVTDSATATRRERICLDTSSRLWRSSVTTATPPAPPIAPGTACPTTGSGAFKLANLTSANSVANPTFRYDSATAASVRSIGITVALNAVASGPARTSTLRASTFVRAKGETAPNLTGTDLSTVCGESGPLLTLSSSVGPASVSYTDLNGASLGATTSGTQLQLPSTATTIVANIDVGGALTQLVRTLAC